MPANLQISLALRDARADLITSTVGAAGKLRVYTGSPPADNSVAATGTLLSESICGSPFAPAASGGVLSPTPPAQVNASASGTAGYYRVYKSDGTTCVMQDTAGTSGAGLIMNTTTVTVGGPVVFNGWTITEGGA